MRLADGWGLAWCVAVLVALSAFFSSRPAAAQQFQPPAQSLNISAQTASTWSEANGESVVQLDGPVSIDLDHTHLSAKQAVVWIHDVCG